MDILISNKSTTKKRKRRESEVLQQIGEEQCWLSGTVGRLRMSR